MALAALDDIELDLHCERASEAKEKLSNLGDHNELPEPDRDRATLIRLRCDALLDEPIDRVILAARRAHARASDPGMQALFLAEAAYGLVAKRCELLARAAAEQIEALQPDSSLGPAVHGWVDLRFDRRQEAMEHYAEATRRSLDAWRGHLGLAHVCYVMGDFSRALAEVDLAEDWPSTRVRKLRLASTVARVRGEWERFLELNEAILDVTRGGFRARSDELERGSALFAIGRRDDALALYRRLWREQEDDYVGTFARELLDHIERGENTGKRVMLCAFPTVSQKRNYCGPAALELVLRSLGIDASQDVIAAKVKDADGTTTWAMTKYLEEIGLRTIRFEANGARLRACIEANLPVIVEEEYSTTNHVAVVIGVDDDLGIVFVQDPMTHVTLERSLSRQTRLGSMLRGAALVAFKKDDEVTAQRLQAAGVVDTEHLRLVDGADAPELRGHSEERLELLEKAITLCEDYPLAWCKRLRIRFGQWLENRSEETTARFLACLREARVRYPGQEWPHQSHGHYLMETRRYEEALIEWEEALRVDPWDSNNAQYIAECHFELERRDDATEAFWNALKIDPAHVRATENFASLALDREDCELAEHLSACALALSPHNPFNHLVAARLADEKGDRQATIARARAGIAEDSSHVYLKKFLAEKLAEGPDAGERAEALEIDLGLVKEFPKWFEPRLAAEALLVRDGRIDEALTLLREGIDVAGDPPVELLERAKDRLVELGRTDEAVALLRQVAARHSDVESVQTSYLDLLFDEDRPEGLELTRRFAAEAPDSDYREVKVAKWLIGTPQQAEAESIVRAALEKTPSFPWRRLKLVEMLQSDRVEEALEIAKAEPKPWVPLLVQKAAMENHLGRYAEALETLRQARALDDESSWAQQEEFTIALLGNDEPRTVLKRLEAEDDDDVFHLRARMSLCAALGEHERGLCVLPRVPVGDWLTRELLIHAIAASEVWRAPLELRYEAFAQEAEELVHRRYARAVLAGSRATRGDRTELDRILSEERNVRRVANLLAPLSFVRQRSLWAEVEQAIAKRSDSEPTVAIKQAHVSAAIGDHHAAIDRLQSTLTRWPTATWCRSCLVEELVIAGDYEGAAARLATMNVWSSYSLLAASAVLQLLAHDWEKARRTLVEVERRRGAYAHPAEEAPLGMAAMAVLARDRELLRAARRIPAPHTDAESKLWDDLERQI